MDVSDQLHAPAALIPGKDPATYCSEGWLDLKVCPHPVAKTKTPFPLPEIEPGSSRP
jgi:hypothetical protein